MKVKRQCVVRIPAEDIIQFFSIKDGVWKVKCSGLPEDYRVVAGSYGSLSNVVLFLLESASKEEGNRFPQVLEGYTPPEMEVYTEIKYIDTSNITLGDML